MHAMQLFKLVKKAAKRKQVKRGVKEVIKSIRKKTSGCVVKMYVYYIVYGNTYY